MQRIEQYAQGGHSVQIGQIQSLTVINVARVSTTSTTPRGPAPGEITRLPFWLCLMCMTASVATPYADLKLSFWLAAYALGGLGVWAAHKS